MPFVIARVNVPVNKELEIKSRLGRAIELVPGKNENYLLPGIEDDFHFYLRGDGEQKAAYIEASIGQFLYRNIEDFTKLLYGLKGRVVDAAHPAAHGIWRNAHALCKPLL